MVPVKGLLGLADISLAKFALADSAPTATLTMLCCEPIMNRIPSPCYVIVRSHKYQSPFPDLAGVVLPDKLDMLHWD